MAKKTAQEDGMSREFDLYRELLLNKSAELLSGLRLKLDTLVRPENPDAESLAELIRQQHVASQLSRIDLLQLQLVTTALHRLDGDDRDGACAECGEPIADMPQRAIPWTNRHIRCEDPTGHPSRTLRESVFDLLSDEEVCLAVGRRGNTP